MNTEHFRKLERMYLAANINQQLFDTTTCSISKGKSEIGLNVVPRYFHALGALHGSVYFKLLDDAAFFAVNSVVEDVFVLTKTFNIHFKRPIVEGWILARCEHVKSLGDGFEAASELRNEQGKIVGSGSGRFVKSKVALTSEIGYQ